MPSSARYPNSYARKVGTLHSEPLLPGMVMSHLTGVSCAVLSAEPDPVWDGCAPLPKFPAQAASRVPIIATASKRDIAFTFFMVNLPLLFRILMATWRGVSTFVHPAPWIALCTGCRLKRDGGRGQIFFYIGLSY